MLTFGLSAASLLITPYVRPFWTQNDGAVVSLVRLGKDAELIHAAADSGYQESAQRVYELLLRVLAGYRDVAPHGMVISLTDVSAGDHKAGNSEFRCQSVYQYMYGCVRSPGWPLCIQVDNFPVSVTRDLPQKGPPFLGGHLWRDRQKCSICHTFLAPPASAMASHCPSGEATAPQISGLLERSKTDALPSSDTFKKALSWVDLCQLTSTLLPSADQPAPINPFHPFTTKSRVLPVAVERN